MRTWYLLSGLAVLGVAGLAGWVTLGSAQPVVAPPDNPRPIIERVRVETPAERPPQKASSAVQPAIERVPVDGGLDDVPPIRLPDDVRPDPVVKPAAKGEPRPAPVPVTESVNPPDLEPLDIPVEPVRPPAKAPAGPASSTGPAVKPKPAAVSPAGDAKVNPVPAQSSAAQPTVTLEWAGPSAVKVGAPADYTLTVKNAGSVPVQKVIAQVRVPTGLTILSVEPKAEAGEGALIWEPGDLAPRQEALLKLKLSSPQRGDVACQAWVTFTGAAIMNVKVRDPRLVVKVTTPEKALVGDPANVVVTVSNPGDHPAEHVRVSANLPEGMDCVRGNLLKFDVGTLNAGEARTLTIPCTVRGTGAQRCEATAEADGGLKSSGNASVAVVQPRLDLAVAGPKLRYLDRKASYTVRVSNPSEAPATNVFVTEVVPAGFKFVSADGGGQFDVSAGAVKWFVGEIPAGEAKQVKFELMAVAQGEFTHKVTASASRGMKAEDELKTAVEGLSAIMMEVVDVDDPVEVGTDTAYEIKITNTGSKAETDVKLTCTLPPQLKLKGVQGPAKYEVVGNEIVFQSLPRLAPRADVVFKVTATAVQKGDARFKASLTTASLVEPVIKVEPTKVYAE